MKLTIQNTLAVSALALSVVACNSDKSTPGYTYMDDMYVSPSLETYQSSDLLEDGMEAQLPVEGTIPRGYHPYEVANTTEAYTAMKGAAGESIVPAGFAGMDPAEGKELYTIFCAHCHGDKGDGNGILVENEKILGVPGYGTERLPDITPASAYHVVMYGKGVMGSHASQLNYEERWKIIRYVWKLRADQSGMDDLSAEEAPAAEATEEMEEQA